MAMPLRANTSPTYPSGISTAMPVGKRYLPCGATGRALLSVRQQGVKINARGERGAARGQYGIFTELFARNFHTVFFL